MILVEFEVLFSFFLIAFTEAQVQNQKPRCKITSCPFNSLFYFNTVTCKCECNLALLDCIAPSNVDVKTCSCVPIQTNCKPRKCINRLFYFDTNTCKCECTPRNCGFNPQYQLNSITCQCELQPLFPSLS